MNRRKMCFLSVLLLSSTLCSCNQANDSSVSSYESSQTDIAFTSTKLPLYMNAIANKSTADLVLLNSDASIPYVSLESGFKILQSFYKDIMKSDCDFTFKDDGGIFTVTRENQASATIDFNKEEITFPDFDEFIIFSCMSNPLDICSGNYYDADNKPIYIKRDQTDGYRQPCQQKTIDLKSHDIPMFYANSTGYLPLQTFSDIFMSPVNAEAIYNGNCVIISEEGVSSAFSSLFYSAPTGNRSQALADFSYKELCLVYDTYYGLKDIHGIPEADPYFTATGLKDDLCSTDPLISGKALAKFVNGYLGDLHSSYSSNSAYAGKSAEIQTNDLFSHSYKTLIANYIEAATFRAAHYPSGISGYEEIGDTAYVTFDHFIMNTSNYYSAAPTSSSVDTVGVIAYAQSQIFRNDSKIKNVVLHLSCNTGGDADAALYTISWMLGRGFVHLKDTFSQSCATSYYKADTNLDHAFDANDDVTSKKLFCLTSPASFSCGNFVPAMLKESNKVTLLGKTTGGGTGSPLPLALADGTCYRLSGFRQISTLKNNAYYDVDQGIAPDHVIDSYDNFYARDVLTNYIDSLI